MSGGYDGPVTVFRGRNDGTFDLGVTMSGPDGKPLAPDSAIAVSLFDWNSDKRPDLFLGSLGGAVYYAPNKGALALGTPVKLTAAGSEIVAPDGGPAVADWDGDKTADLLLGSEDGSVTFYKGVKGTVPTFEKGRAIVPPIVPPGVEDDQKRLDIFDATAGKRPSMRPKPFVGDWNGDGKSDLVVGDFTMLRGTPPKLTEAEAAEHQKFTAEIARLSKILDGLQSKAKSRALKDLGLREGQTLTADQESQLAERSAAILSEDPQFEPTNNALIEVFGNDQKYQPPVDYHGFVYVFLRK